MNFGTMFGDVLRSLFRRTVTRQYPFEREEAPERLRGKLEWNPEQCTGCSLCAKDCPADAIEIITIDKASKRFVLRYHLDRCTFCAQCVVSCAQNALELSSDDWELADTDKEKFILYYGTEEDVRHVLDGTPEPDAEVAEES